MIIKKPSLNTIILLLASLCMTAQADAPADVFTEISPPSINILDNTPESLVKLDHVKIKTDQTDCDDSSDIKPNHEHMDKNDTADSLVDVEDESMGDDQADCDFHEIEYEEQPFDYSPQDVPSPDEQHATPALPPLPVIDTFAQPRKKLDFITTNQVFFDHDKAVLSDTSKKVLDDISFYIENTDTISRILIDGHTDIRASKQYNYHLSDKRSLAVHDYLTKQGVSSELMHIVGLGEDNPIDESWTRTGKQHNRRVEIYILQHNPQL